MPQMGQFALRGSSQTRLRMEDPAGGTRRPSPALPETWTRRREDAGDGDILLSRL